MTSRSLKSGFLVLPDMALLLVGLFLALVLRYGDQSTTLVWNQHIQYFSTIFLLWLVIFYIHGLYELDTFRRYTTLIFRLASAMSFSVVAAVLYLYFQPELFLTPRRFLLLDAGLTFVLLLGWRLLVKSYLQKRTRQAACLLDMGGVGDEMEKELGERDYLGVRVAKRVTGLRASDLAGEKIDIVIIPDELGLKPELAKQVYEARKLGVGFVTYKELYEDLFRKVPVSDLNELWFLRYVDYKQRVWYETAKRLVDFIAGLMGFVCFAVSYPVVAILIKLTSEGPVLFKQKRVGQAGVEFYIYKFRTMKVDQPGNTWTSHNDARITKVGKILRVLRLDELPQCVNLIRGEMSLTGPRPEQPHLVEELRRAIPFYDERHLVKPGLTGWAQINDAYAATVEESRKKLQYDLYYIKHRSLAFDLEIILKTIYYVLSFRGR